MKRVYIAGAITADNPTELIGNIRKGIKKSANLLSENVIPFCPFLDYQFLFFNETLTADDLKNYSMAWLEVCDEVFVLEGWENSKGTIAEIKRAGELGIPVMYEGQ